MATKIDLTKGDATDALGNVFFQYEIELDEGETLEGCSLRFQVGKDDKKIIKDFTADDVVENLLDINLSAQETELLEEGSNYASLKLFDEDGKPITIIRNDPEIVAKGQVVDNKPDSEEENSDD